MNYLMPLLLQRRDRRGLKNGLLVSASLVCLLFLSAAEDPDDVLNMTSNNNVYLGSEEEDMDLDGGFSSLEGMLQWSIGHSDPVKLKEAAAQDAQHLTINELKHRQLKDSIIWLPRFLDFYFKTWGEETDKELMDHLETPSDRQLMQIAVADLNNSSLSIEEHDQALQELLVLVETTSNANDMDKVGGLIAVIRELGNSDQRMRVLSAWILGKASQNNPVVQKQILDLGALTKLMKMVTSGSVEEATKGLFAISAVIRNNINGQELFFAEGGELILKDLMSNPDVDIRLKKKSASLVADLAVWQVESNNKVGSLFMSSRIFLKSVVDLTSSADIDLQEKALTAIKNLLQLESTEAADFRDFCELDKVVESMREKLQHLIAVESGIDFYLDMDNLLREVEFIFRKKLEKVY